jgi:Sap-like sulfolipid-1-addressing protein
MGNVFVFALTAAFNPTLLAAVTVMLVLPSPKRLLIGYLLGALMTSITLGLLIVFALGGSSSATSTARHTINPAVDVAFGLIILVIVFVVGTGRDTRRRERSVRKKAAKADKSPPKWQQALSGGSARTTFVVGALLTLPGASYLAGMNELSKQNVSDLATVLSVIAFNIIMLALLEIPLLGYTFSPDRTAVTVRRFSAWLSAQGGRIALALAGIVGIALLVRGVTGLST